MSSIIEVDLYRAEMGYRCPLLSDVYSIANGLKLHLDHDGGTFMQDMFYNGLRNDHYMIIVFFFTSNGLVSAFAMNKPERIN